MSANARRCPQCQQLINDANAKYCSVCREAIDPALITELQWLYGALNDLDTRIARGEGDHPITTLRNEYRERYLSERRAPAVEAPSAPLWPITASAPSVPGPASAPVAQQAPSAPVAAAATANAAPVTPIAPRPPGPVFSWQAFLSEQAIAIMMYMGGFLGLVAMLTFEIGGWQSLGLTVKLGAIIVVYVAFGVVGLVMRRVARLRTVSSVYLGVFALMTPLLALGIYRFGLQAAGFSGAAMLCLSSAYAAIVYLALAVRTRFVTYAYLGWAALVLAALAVVFWAAKTSEWLAVALVVASLALLLPALFHRIPLVAQIEIPALQLSGLTTAAAAIFALIMGLLFATDDVSQPSTLAFAVATCALTPVFAVWSYLARRLTGSLHAEMRANILAVLDWSVLAWATLAVIAIATWAGADRHAMSVVVSLLALVETGLLFLARERALRRSLLRYLVEGLTLLLVVSGCLIVFGDAPPNWPYLLALTVGIVATGTFAAIDALRWWLLPAGAFLSLDYHALVDLLFHARIPAPGPHALPFWAIATAGLAVALILPWLVAASSSPVLRRFGLTLFVVALANSIYATMNLFGYEPLSGTLVLGFYVLLALVAGWRVHQEPIAGIVAAGFGLLLPLPFIVTANISDFAMAAFAIITALLALAIRRVLGRPSSVAAYLTALWVAILVCGSVLLHPSAHAWRFLGFSSGIWLSLVIAVLATIAIVWDTMPWVLFIPAFFGFTAAILSPNIEGVWLALALAAAGMLLRWWGGRWVWSIAWYIAALLASLFQLAVFTNDASQGTMPLAQPVFVALGFALVAYIAAAVERQPWLTAAAVIYVVLAAVVVQGPRSFVETVAITYGAVVVGLALRLRFGRPWALACYAAAIVPSFLAVLRAVPPGHGVLEAVLLVFAVTAYGVALVERTPTAGVVSAIYAGLAVIAQPDAHALLPLSLALAALGIGIGRAGGWRWSWPAYLASLVAATLAAFLARHELGFEALALLALAVATYLIAMIESQAEVLALAMFLGVLSLAVGIGALDLPAWQAALAFVALSWLYTTGQWFWGALPWLGHRPAVATWIDPEKSPTDQANWRDMRFMGRVIHHISGLLVGSGVVLAAPLLADALSPHAPMAQIEAVALLSLAALVVLSAWTIPLHRLWYVAGGLLALAISWELRWIGAENIQAFVLAPASYLLVIGALLPSDHRIRNGVRRGQIASLAGALLLLLPTLAQSFITAFDENWIYASVLALEALVIAAIGVGTHTRTMTLLGTGFFGVAAIRGALLAYSSGVPIALIIAVLALLLMGSATWLSLRPHHEVKQPLP
jgi:hypothetical protein